MADNGTAASGPTIAWDDIGGAAYQRIKVTFGADGTATDVSASDRLPVDVGTSIAVSGTFWQATQPVSIASAVPVTDNGGSLTVDGTVGVSGSVAVTGTFWQATQPVSIASMPSTPVTGTFWQATQPVSGTVTANAGTGTFAVSAASLPLPSGAATSAKQPALGTAGTASTDVLTVQGIASMTALKVDGSAVTQPVSGTFWQATQPVSGTFWQATQPVSGTITANIGTSGSLALDATLTGGTQQSKITDGTNVATVKAASTAAGATDKALVVAISPNNTVPVSLAANQSVNVAQMNGVTVTMGNGASGAGVQRVTLASDSTGQVALAAGSATIGALTANQSVNQAQVAGVATATGNGVVGTGVQRVAIASDNTAFPIIAAGNAASGVADSGNPVKVGGVYNSTKPTYTNGQRGDLQIDTRGNQFAVIRGEDGVSSATLTTPTDGLGTFNALWTYGYNVVYNGSTWNFQRGDTTGTYTVNKPATSGGLSSARVLTGTTGVIKGSAGQLYKLTSVRNANAAVRYLHLYNKATAPTLSTDTPIHTIALLASSVQNSIDIGDNIGADFPLGIAWAYTTDNIAIPTAAGTSTELMFSATYK